LISTKDIKKDNLYLISKDYTVSNEEYKLFYNEDYDMLQTYPIPDDIASYYKSEEYISHTDSNQSVIDKVYKIVRNYTLKGKLKLINSYKTKGKKILDIGAGTGDFLKICKDNSWDVSGVEPSENAREIANKKQINLLVDITEIKNNTFDVITMWHVLEHVINLNEYILSLKKLLKQNGVLIIAVPNYKSYDAIYYNKHWAAFDVPRHISHFSQKSIVKIFKEVDMNVEEIKPMKFDSYYVSLLSEKYKNGKMKPIKAFFKGFQSNLKAKKTKEYSSLIYIIKNDK